MRRDIYIGLVEIRPAAGGSLLGQKAEGAFTTVVALADNISDFKRVVGSALTDLELELVSVDEVDDYWDRLRKFEVEQKTRDMAASLSIEHPVLFREFYTFNFEDI